MIRGRMKSWLRLKAILGGRRPWQSVDPSLAPRGESPTGPELLQSPEDVPGVASDAFKLALSMQIADSVSSDQFYAMADRIPALPGE